MDKNLHDIDDLFTGGIEGHEEAPGNQVWEAIGRRLDNKGMESVRRKYARLKWLSLLLLLISAGVITYLLSNHQQKKNNDSAITEKGNTNNTANMTGKDLDNKSPDGEKESGELKGKDRKSVV